MTNTPRQQKDAVVTPTANGAMLERPDTGVTYEVNSSALAIWTLCDGETTIDEMADAVSALTGTSRDRALEEIKATIAEFRSAGLVD